MAGRRNENHRDHLPERPGGKDDSVRDVVAAIIVDRAKVLAAHGSKLTGAQDKIDIGNSDVTY